MQKQIKLALVDDHILLRSALASLINSFEDFKVVSECNNGAELIQKMKSPVQPDVILLDLNMPEMDGYETALWLKDHHPQVHVLMLTMYDSELTLIRLLQAGVKGFLKKDIEPKELRNAIQTVVQTGYYYSSHTAGRLASLFRNHSKENLRMQNTLLSEQEIHFLQLACSDMTYKEVAQKMKLTPRTVDALRDTLFTKLDVKSRVGLAMVALKNGIVPR